MWGAENVTIVIACYEYSEGLRLEMSKFINRDPLRRNKTYLTHEARKQTLIGLRMARVWSSNK